jgi:hypothetical protein
LTTEESDEAFLGSAQRLGDDSNLSEHETTDSIFLQEAENLPGAARERNLTLRAMGATAIRMHCPKRAIIHGLLGRRITDVDFVARSNEAKLVLKVFEDAGYVMDRNSQYRAALVGRYVLEKHDRSLHADLFFDELKMNHTLDLRKRLHLDFPTLTVSDLLLEKMQIVRINEKDVKDTILMLLEHPIANHDTDSIDAGYVADILAADWGFYYTFTMNLSKVETFTYRYEQIQEEDKQQVISEIATLRQAIEDKPKNLRWKLRARTGTSSKWYRDVDELT